LYHLEYHCSKTFVGSNELVKEKVQKKAC